MSQTWVAPLGGIAHIFTNHVVIGENKDRGASSLTEYGLEHLKKSTISGCWLSCYCLGQQKIKICSKQLCLIMVPDLKQFWEEHGSSISCRIQLLPWDLCLFHQMGMPDCDPT